jgi:hypothetical protein
MTPEEKATRQVETEQRVAEWRASNPERAAEVDRLAREATDKFLEERRVMRETNLDAYLKLVANEPTAARDPDLYFAKQQRNLQNQEMKKDLIAKREAERAAKLAARVKN